jgi:predicted HTH transcriptional regulator
MHLPQIISQTEGRRLEFKAILPEKSDLAKTIVAFANDAGGELYIGIQNEPRKITGLPEEDLMSIKEQISNIIYDRCYPAILPEITFLTEEDKHIIRVTVYRGSMPPYYLKEKGKLKGTYIRVGSTNRLADETIIAELERRKRNVSFDSEVVMEKTIAELNIDNFKKINKTEYPTNALVLFSDDKLRNSIFHFAKVECARFKGTSSEEFIDQKSILSNIATQAEEAYNFVLRHINKGAIVEGVYTVSRWEYPVKAIREAIRNAVVHRDYSLTGKDVKVAVYDDMVEIASPGLLPPSIDYDAMESRQSDARNKIIAPVFKRMGIIDQWGNGLKLISDELKDYPNIELRWKEVGLSFQLQFVKLDYVERQDYPESTSNGVVDYHNITPNKNDRGQVGTKSGASREQVLSVLSHYEIAQDAKSLMQKMGLSNRTKFKNKYINPLIDEGLLEMTIPDKPNSSLQKYRITELGKQLKEKL